MQNGASESYDDIGWDLDSSKKEIERLNKIVKDQSARLSLQADRLRKQEEEIKQLKYDVSCIPVEFEPEDDDI